MTMSLGNSAPEVRGDVGAREAPQKENKHVELFRQLYEALRKRNMSNVISVLEKINIVAAGDYVNWMKLLSNAYVVSYEVDEGRVTIDAYSSDVDVRVFLQLQGGRLVQVAKVGRGGLSRGV